MSARQKRNLPRLFIQWSIIAYLLFLFLRPFFQKDFVPDFEAYCPFGGIQSLSSFLLNGSLACSMTSTQIAMGIMLILGIFLFSKLFCAFICPVGTISEWLGKIGNNFRINIRISELTDKVLRSLKYILLFITFYFTLESNELFCKKFDPFYAVVTGFSSDVVLLYATITLLIVVIGSIVFRLFWCKYICPLGALSNLIKFSWFFAAILLIYIVVVLSGYQVSYLWPLTVAAIGGYLLEITATRWNFFPLAKITRSETTCTSCQLCTRQCPQAIDVAKMRVVTSVDCNLCGDCLVACPEKDTLQISKKNGLKWLPPVAAGILFVMGLIVSSSWELPTIDQRWGTPEEIRNSSLFTKSGLSEIKCYGSSMAFAAKMKEVKGVLGVSTYVASHKVKVYFNPAVTNEQILMEELFVPRKTTIRKPGNEITEIDMVSVQLDNFFNPSDFDNLAVLLKEKSEVLGLESSFSCPVTVRIYFPARKEMAPDKLVELLETKELLVPGEPEPTILKLSYKVVGQIKVETIKTKNFYVRLFQPSRRTFNWQPNYQDKLIDTLEAHIDPELYDIEAVPYFVSHISNDPGVVGFISTIDSAANVKFKILFLDSLTNRGNVINNIKKDTLIINYEGGETGKMKNMFKFQ